MELTDYQKKLLDPRWQIKRLDILKRDGFCCRVCGDASTTLEVHHKKYSSEPWAVEDKYLVSLCTHCHRVVTLCHRLKLIPININKVPFLREKMIYLVNVKNQTGNNILHVFSNLTESKIIYSGLYFSRETLLLMLQTF